MKTIKISIIVLVAAVLALTACKSEELQPTEINELPNPASVFCKENGGTLEMRQAADGSVAGFCLFADGSECDEWAYFRGECGQTAKITAKPFATVESTVEASGGYMQPGTSEEFTDWWGVIKSAEPGAQYDDTFERQDLGGVIYFGIDSMDPTVKAQIDALRDSGKIVHLYGLLFSNVSDYNGSQIQVARIVVEE